MRRARALGSVTLSCLLSLVACGNSSDSGKGSSGGGNSNSSAGGAQGKAGNAAAGTDITIGGGSNTAGGGGTDSGESCVETKQVGKLVPLDLFIMLDVSGSMSDPTSNRANAPTKWNAVKGALKSFLSDPASSGLGVGIQYFPLIDPSVPQICTSDAQCGTHGPCFLKFCLGAAGFHACGGASDCVAQGEDYGPCTPLRFCSPPSTDLALCHDANECERGQSCVPYNECSADHNYICQTAGVMCVDQQGMNHGTCGTPNSVCVHTSSCDVAAYAKPAAAMATLPGNQATVQASIDAQAPHGDTPTSPALSGAIQAASSWAAQHPDHTVAVLLATDGEPTECITDQANDPQGINGVRSVAAAGLKASPSIATFVIGVFGPNDTDARMNLNQIAMAGGTDTAFLVDTSGDVTQQFLQALNKIRASQLTCEYLLPAAPSGQTLDYKRVNVDFSNAGSTERLGAVKNAAACGTGEGWYYDQDPDQNMTPTKIVICPATCTRLQAASAGSVQVALGCNTQVR